MKPDSNFLSLSVPKTLAAQKRSTNCQDWWCHAVSNGLLKPHERIRISHPLWLRWLLRSAVRHLRFCMSWTANPTTRFIVTGPALPSIYCLCLLHLKGEIYPAKNLAAFRCWRETPATLLERQENSWCWSRVHFNSKADVSCTDPVAGPALIEGWPHFTDPRGEQ